VLAARDFYKLDHGDILVICDDFNLPLAKLRIRAQGSAGGQKGLQDIIRCLGDECFPRLRIGIGPPPEHWDVSDFVLSKFSKEEKPDVERAIVLAADAVEAWLTDGIESSMNRYNAN
jgi:PTH1 family peptidyl-tRNA hydrolase